MSNDFYTTSIDKAVKFAEHKKGGYYYITIYHCSCGNLKAKKLTGIGYVIYICDCSQYAINSKKLKNE